MKYFKGDKYYSDLYDLLTIKRCLDWEENSKSSNERVVTDLCIYHIKGERYKRRSETINDWIMRDKVKDEKVEKTIPPENIYCKFCSVKMELLDKDLYLFDSNNSVMFWFSCPNCVKKRAIYDNGEELEFKPDYCKNCSSVLKKSYTRKGEEIITNIACLVCGFTSKKEIENLKINDDKFEEEQRHDRELLRRYRSKYCLNDQEGKEYISYIVGMEQITALMKELKEKENNPIYKKVKEIKKIKIRELEKILSQKLTKEKYINLKLGKPDLDRFIIVSFMVVDDNDNRQEYDSRKQLKKLMNKFLEKTNWRLMREGINYRLGILTGKLKAYEQEEDLIKIIEVKK